MALYQTLPSLLPIVFTPYSQVVITDIDGDGFSEVIVLNSDILQLAVARQLTFNQLAPQWSDQTETLLNCWAANMANAPTGSLTVHQGDQMIAGDFNGDGIDELFVYNVYTANWRIAQWQAAAQGLVVICQSTGCPNWKIQQGDQYVVFPNPNGQKGAGILTFNYNSDAQDANLGVLLYQGNAITCPTLSTGKIDNWAFEADSQFIPGNFVVGTEGSFALLNGGAGYVACLTWDGSAFHVSQGQGGSVGGANTWNIGATNQLQAADLDGNGIAEVFVYSPDSHYLGVWKWNGGATPPQWECPVCTKDVPTFVIGGQDQYFATQSTGQTAATIMAYGQSYGQLGILSCLNFADGFQISYPGLTGGWKVTQNDQFYGAALTVKTQPRILATSPQSSGPMIAGFDATLGGLSLGSTVALPLPGWTPTFLAQAPPATAFPSPAFPTADQQAIYTYISNIFPNPQFPEDTGGDLRAKYTDSEWAGKFEPFAQYLATVPDPPSGHDWQGEDWTTVQGAIMRECNCVDSVYTTYQQIGALALKVYTQQQIDLNKVKDNIQVTPDATATLLSYWGAQVGIAVLWGVGAAAGGVLGVICSVGASLLGSAAGEFLPSSATARQVSAKQVEEQILNTFGNSLITGCAAPNTILQDPVKLEILNELTGTTWDTQEGAWAQAEEAFSNADRVVMYQQLLPFTFKIGEVMGVNTPVPFYIEQNTDPNQSIQSPFGADNNFYVSEQSAVLWDDSVLYIPRSSIFAMITAPSTALQQDLSELGLKSELLAGAGQWRQIARQGFPGGNQG